MNWDRENFNRLQKLRIAADLEQVVDSIDNYYGIEEDQPTYLKTESNASTGYAWIVDSSGCGEDLIVQVDSVELPPPDERRDGRSGMSLISLLATSDVECELRLAYARPWEF